MATMKKSWVTAEIYNGQRRAPRYGAWEDLGLDILPGRNHISAKEQERIAFEKISSAEIFLCFRDFERVVTKKMKFMVQPWG
jgi:hypothetical protein